MLPRSSAAAAMAAAATTTTSRPRIVHAAATNLLGPSRTYASPVNPKSSLDMLLGTAPPPPPPPRNRSAAETNEPDEEDDNGGAPSPNPIPTRPAASSRQGDERIARLSQLLRGVANGTHTLPPSARRSDDDASGRGHANSGKSLADVRKAIGAVQRNAGAIPTRDLDGDFVLPPGVVGPPERDDVPSRHGQPQQHQHQQPAEGRESPHAIDDLHGRNELDERVLSAALALHALRDADNAASSSPPPSSSSSSSSIGKTATIASLLAKFHDRAGHQLSIELPYEPTPPQHRRVRLTSALSDQAELDSAQEDGVVLIAYVAGLDAEAPSSSSSSSASPRGRAKISVCSGFAVRGGEKLGPDDGGEGKGPLVVTCAHTLRGSLQAGPDPRSLDGTDAGVTRHEGSSDVGGSGYGSKGHSASSSVALAITRQGHVYPVRTLLSSLPLSDLVLLQLGDEALVPGEDLPGAPFLTASSSETSSSSSEAAGVGAEVSNVPSSSTTTAARRTQTKKAGLRTLPVSPFPPVVGTELAVSSFWGWEDDSGVALPAFEFVAAAGAAGAAEYPSQAARAAGAGGASSSSPLPPTTAPPPPPTPPESGERAPLLRRSVSAAPPPEGREVDKVRQERDDAARSRWARARLVEYKDPCGGEALTGTYDELWQMDFKLLPRSLHNPPALSSDLASRPGLGGGEAAGGTSSLAHSATGTGAPPRPPPPAPPMPSRSTPPPTSASKPSTDADATASSAHPSASATTSPLHAATHAPPPGSSGGPIVDVDTGAVVGVTSGTKVDPLEGLRGVATPAEKVFEFFALPGLGRKR